MKVTALLLFKLLVLSISVNGQGKISRLIHRHDSASNHKKLSFIPLPVFYYSPETHLAFGAIGIFLFRTGNDSTTRTSNADVAFVETTNNQTIIDPTYTIFTKGEKYYIKGYFLYSRFPEFFFGIGNYTSPDLKENVSYKSFRINNRTLRKIKGKLFAGLQYQYYNTFDVRFTDNDKYRRHVFSGAEGSITSGAGVAVVLDKRDNILTPTKGSLMDFSFYHYGPFLGSQYIFSNYIIDMRKYFRLKKQSSHTVLAVQALFNFNTGDVPFKQMATLGGANILRGYYSGRFRNYDLVVIQTELRQHLFGRFGFALFADMGQVEGALNEIAYDGFKYTFGGGLRYLMSKRENLNIRIDAGFGDKTQGFYINISEAF